LVASPLLNLVRERDRAQKSAKPLFCWARSKPVLYVPLYRESDRENFYAEPP
jgi:hypothetical protein